MRRTRFMSWLFLVLSLAFFFIRDFRYALEAPLANWWWWWSINKGYNEAASTHPRLARLYTLARYVSPQQLRILAEEAVKRGDSKFVAFAVLNLPQKDMGPDIMRLADEAVEADRQLTWIYYGLFIQSTPQNGWGKAPQERLAYILSRLDRLQAFDPDNAVPHLCRAELIRANRGRDWPEPQGGYGAPKYLSALAKEMEWRKEMEAAFACPRYDSYAVREFDLFRNVLRQRGWDHPMVVQTIWEFRGISYLFWLRTYTNLLVLKLGAEAEAAHQVQKALGYYWRAAHFGSRMQLQAPLFIERLIGMGCQRIAYEKLPSALRKAGKEQEAAMVEYADKQVLQGVRRYRGDTLVRSSNYNWAVLLVNLFAGLVAVFLPATVVSVLYVNAKLWVRKKKKGRLYDVVTIAENYLPTLLFLACLGLYLTFVPFGQNYAFYMTTKEPFDNVPSPLFEKAFPAWDNYGRLGGLPLQDPFRDYAPYALSGFVFLALVTVVARWRQARAEPSATLDAGDVFARKLNVENVAIYLLIAVTGAAFVATHPPWRIAFAVELVWATLLAASLWVTSTFARQARAEQRSVLRARVTEVGAYLLLLISALVSGIGLGLFAVIVTGRTKGTLEDWTSVLALAPALVAGFTGAARMRFRALTLSVFGLLWFASASLIYLNP